MAMGDIYASQSAYYPLNGQYNYPYSPNQATYNIACPVCGVVYLSTQMHYCTQAWPSGAIKKVKKVKKMLPKGFKTGSKKLDHLPSDLRKLADEVLVDKFT